MYKVTTYKVTTWMLLASVMISPSVTYSADFTGHEKTELRNVQLNQEGILGGQLLDQSGVPVINADVTIRSQSDINKVALALRTDANGRFAVAGLKNGVCVLNAGNDSFACRVWDSKTAPPQSLTSIALVRDESIARGNSNCNNCNDGPLQRCKNKIRCMSSAQKAGLGLLIAAAIVIPIALDDDDDAS